MTKAWSSAATRNRKRTIALQSGKQFLRTAWSICAEWGVEKQTHHRHIVLTNLVSTSVINVTALEN
jgi:hypothetical protein